MPSYLPVAADGMNYASAVFVGGTAVSAIWYFVWGKTNYHGPPTSGEEDGVRPGWSSGIVVE